MRIDRKKLKIAMVERDLSRQMLSDLSGVGTGTISSVCGGKNCSNLTGRALAAALGMELADLLEGPTDAKYSNEQKPGDHEEVRG